MPDPSALQKLLDKGVDITAGVITSIISAGLVAAIATFTWRWNRHRDLKFEALKLQQQHAFEMEQRGREEQERLDRLRLEREDLARVAAGTLIRGEQGEMIDHYIRWMTRNNLAYMQRNAQVIATYAGASEKLKGSAAIVSDSQSPKRAADLAESIRNTQLLHEDVS